MRRRSVLPLILLCLGLPLWAQTEATVLFSDASSVPAFEQTVRQAVLKATEESIAPRVREPGALVVQVDSIERTGPFSLVCELVFSYGEKSFSQRLAGSGDDEQSLSEDLYRTLLFQLRYDASVFSDLDGPSLSIGYCYHGSCSTVLGDESDVSAGNLYAVVDQEGAKTGLLVCDGLYGTDGRIASFLPLHDGTVLPGMGLEKLSGNTVSLSVPLSWDDGTTAVGVEALYSRDIGLYPFLFSCKASVFRRSDDTVAMGALVGTETLLPLSTVFASPAFGNWSLVASCYIGVGQAEGDLLLASEAGIGVRRYIGPATGLQLGISKRNWSSSDSEYDGGLSLLLSTSYTW
jgi:hypothetical protein